MPGPTPKPSALRQRKNKKSGASILMLPSASAKESAKVSASKVRPIPNPDARTWHPLTLTAWAHAWASPMASQWIETDEDALGRLALLWDEFYKYPDAKVMAEIRLQEQRFGLSPLDRSRLQWELGRAEESEQRQVRRSMSPKRTGTHDPRSALMAVK